MADAAREPPPPPEPLASSSSGSDPGPSSSQIGKEGADGSSGSANGGGSSSDISFLTQSTLTEGLDVGNILLDANDDDPSQGRRSGRLKVGPGGKSGGYFNTNYDENSLHMLKCDPFGKEQPGSGLPGAQPFGVTIDPLVLATMDFHSHLLSTEIIGFLGGHWDAKSRMLHLREAFPCRSIQADTGSVHVELDPLAEVQVRQAIEGRQMQVVGWYHSHPVFAPQPSIRDVQNQANYQNLFHDDKSNLFPFVGTRALLLFTLFTPLSTPFLLPCYLTLSHTHPPHLHPPPPPSFLPSNTGMIISPYDTRLSSFSSTMTMFYVEQDASIGGGRPKRVSYVPHSLPPPLGANGKLMSPQRGSNGATQCLKVELPPSLLGAHRTPLMELPPDYRRYWEEQLRITCRTLCALIHYYKETKQRTQLKAAWRKKSKGGGAASGAGAGGAPVSKLEKLARSVRGRLVEAFSPERVDPLLAAVVECIETTWVGKA